MTTVLPFAALLGLAIGSFLNVVIHRVPVGASLITPASHCPSCDSPVRARHNVPVLGWLVLRGRCADCRAPIAVRYPLVELATAVLFVAVTWQLGLSGALPAYLYMTATGIALTMIDIDHRRLPNTIVVPSYPILAVLLALPGDWEALLRAALAAATLLGFYLLLVLAYPTGMGWGDVKLAGVLGAALGYLSWQSLLIGAFAGFFLGAAFGVATRRRSLPFGPFMIAGFFTALFFADPLAELYSRILLGL
jgi:leader peptidase (prepilin peptidase) / N-methyltransferase